jgi:hypothetical protein
MKIAGERQVSIDQAVEVEILLFDLP